MEENLAWLTQKTEEPKSNKGNFTFPKHTVNVIKSNRNKSEWEPSPFLHQPPLFRFISSPFFGKGSPMKIAVHCPIWCWNIIINYSIILRRKRPASFLANLFFCFYEMSYIFTASKVSKYGVFSGRIFRHLGWIRRDAEYLSLFTPRIHSKCGKIRTTRNSVFGHFSRSVSLL